ncbi:DUF4276 family protein [Larkinella humicola]|uniref:DUF4276 family protein n=1 Tax=Larkinella humicola TaxID=2607654 RepID=A0A5N1JDA6_9BACT|nr:DUF4276 family protein [Larkinella humicola]KAA9347123.1 DUF4276 family protein [Larkinella humicola]
MKRNKRLNYTIIAEGYTEYKFIPLYLRQVAEKVDIQVVRSSLDLKGKQPSKSKVLQEASKLCNLAIQQNHHLIIAGVDLDEADHESELPLHSAVCENLKIKLKIYSQYKNRIILFVPMQAIEHWLGYQAYKVGKANKFANNSLESKPQGELKRILYGNKEDGRTMETVAEKIAIAADFDELAKQSRSFDHFHKQIVTFLASYNNTTKP